MVKDRMTNRKPLHWSHHIPLWYWVFVALPFGLLVSFTIIFGIMYVITI